MTWQERGSCRTADPSLFHYSEGERTVSRRAKDWAAKRICAGCPVLQECAEWALATAEPWGTWGAMTEAERAKLLGRKTIGGHRILPPVYTRCDARDARPSEAEIRAYANRPDVPLAAAVVGDSNRYRTRPA